MKGLLYKSFPTEIKLLDDIKGIVEGYAAVYGNVDDGGDRISKGAFSKTLRENKDRFRFMYNHNELIGVLLDVKSDQHGLWYKAQLNDVGKGAEIKGLLRIGARLENSFGYNTIKYKWDGDIRDLTELRVWEISIVDWGMNDKSRMLSVKKRQMIENKYLDFDTALEQNNLYNAPYRMQNSFGEAIDSILYGFNLTDEEKYNLLQDSLTQFTDRFGGWIEEGFTAELFKGQDNAQEFKSAKTSLENTKEPDASTPAVLPADLEARFLAALEEMGNRLSKI